VPPLVQLEIGLEKVEIGFSGLAYVGLVWGIGVGIRARLWVFLHVFHS
jgi:hypothetical protein